MIFTLAAMFVNLSLGAHVASAWGALRKRPTPPFKISPPVSILMPLCGLEVFSSETLDAVLDLEWPNYEVIFCVADKADPVIVKVQRAMAARPQTRSRLIIGDVKISANPKLNNLVRGWRAAAHGWIVMVDSNVLMPRHRLRDLFDAWQTNTGMVCAPPVGSRPRGFGAAVECAFLNGYGARWQFAADAMGMGYAQGKTMLWRRETIEEAGGLQALGVEPAEDAAATKLVRAQGLIVSLARPAADQPLGARALGAVWARQVRWARLRRATFPIAYAAEILTTSIWPMAAAALAAFELGVPPAIAALITAGIWYGVEAALSRIMGWSWTLTGALTRDAMIPALWIAGWAGARFNWRGNSMSVAKS